MANNSSNKDVIYLDPDDDITAVIDKVKASKAKIIALVPPKRANMLSSVVNLRLLKRAAEADDKKVVLITSEQVLASMAGGISMFVAKDLNTAPQIPKVEEIELPSDVIQAEPIEIQPPEELDEEGVDVDNNAQTPVGQLAGKTAVAAADMPKKSGRNAKKAGPENASPKVPDIKKFRKKIFIGIGALIVLILVWWWAFLIAPSATLTLYGQTDEISVSDTITLDSSGNVKLDTDNKVLPVVRREVSDEKTVNFDATGEEDIGKEATGTVILSRQSLSTTTVPAGTKLKSSSGLVFTTDEAASIPPSQLCNSGGSVAACPGEAEVGITATEKGKQYNGASGGMSGAGNGVEASIQGSTGGGSSKIVTVVSKEDVEDAKSQLEDEDGVSFKDQLKGQFDDKDLLIIEGSFEAKTKKPSVEPAVGQEASKAKLTSTITYSLLAVEKSDYEKLLDALVKEDLIDGKKLVDYDYGGVSFKSAGGSHFDLIAKPMAGPDIDMAALKDSIKGKRFSEAVTLAEAEQGIAKADLKLSPFWVFSVPGNTDKIEIKIESSSN